MNLLRTEAAGVRVVESESQRGSYYVLTGIGSPFIVCTCPAAQNNRPCKHVVAGLGESERLMEGLVEENTKAIAIAEKSPIVAKAAEMQLRVAAHLEAWGGFIALGEGMLASKLLPPSIQSREAAALVLMKAYSLDIEPTEAFAFIDVIKGVPNLRAQMVRALVARSGKGRIQVVESSSTRAICVGFRTGWAPTRVEFTIEDAQRAGLLTNDNYKKYASDMLVARASVRVGRRMFPDVLSGMDVAEFGEQLDTIEAPVTGGREDILEGEFTVEEPMQSTAGEAPPPPPSFDEEMATLGLGWPDIGRIVGGKSVNDTRQAIPVWLAEEGNTEERLLSLAATQRDAARA